VNPPHVSAANMLATGGIGVTERLLAIETWSESRPERLV